MKHVGRDHRASHGVDSGDLLFLVCSVHHEYIAAASDARYDDRVG